MSRPPRLSATCNDSKSLIGSPRYWSFRPGCRTSLCAFGHPMQATSRATTDAHCYWSLENNLNRSHHPSSLNTQTSPRRNLRCSGGHTPSPRLNGHRPSTPHNPIAHNHDPHIYCISPPHDHAKRHRYPLKYRTSIVLQHHLHEHDMAPYQDSPHALQQVFGGFLF